MYFPSSGKSRTRWSKSRCSQSGLGYSFSLKVKWGYISAQKLKSERSKSFAVSISMQTKTYQGLLKSPPDWKIFPKVPVNAAEVGQNHDVCKVVSATLSVLK